MAALLLAIPRKPQDDEKPEQLPPPAISVIFQGGAKNGPSQPTPAPEPDNSQPSPQATPAPVTPPEPQAPPEPAAPPQQAPQPPTPPLEEAEPAPETSPAPETPAEQAPPEPPPVPPGPPRVELYPPAPPAPPAAPFEVPELPPPPPPPPPRPLARPAPRPRPSAPPSLAQPRNPFSPTFREWSLGRPSAPSSQGLGPNVAGPQQQAASQIQGAEKLGTDWRNALSAWVEAHKYYPQQAIINGEDGSPQVEVTVRRDGKVLDVQLENRSGSQWLDIALQAMFRGARLPPFPDTTKEDQITFHFTMHYILIRR